MILRPLAVLAVTIALGTFMLGASAQAQLVKSSSLEFDRFVAELWKDAQAQGISRGTFVKAFAGVTPDPRVIATTKRQPEYNKPAGAYINSIASPVNASQGLRKEVQWRETFDAVERKFRVERWYILAIWGMETSYGALKDRWDGIRSS